jgi:PHD-finger
MDNLEDWKSESILRWCIRVRSLVLVPASKELADHARPLPEGDLSEPMLSLITDATSLGVFGLPDVDSMVNFLKCMSWSLFALSVLRRRATLDELQKVLSKSSSLKLSDEKPIRTIKLMIQRALQCQVKVRRALAPKPGQTKPLSVDMLKGLLLSAEDNAVEIPEKMQLKCIVADKGARHCICGGPNYGGFMLCCDKCDLWFHGPCVGTVMDSESLSNWRCPGCRGDEFPPLPENLESESYTPWLTETVIQKQELSRDVDCSPHAPNPEKMWPPFGLKNEVTMAEVLGPECESFPDDCAPLPSRLYSSDKVVRKPMKPKAKTYDEIVPVDGGMNTDSQLLAAMQDSRIGKANTACGNGDMDESSSLASTGIADSTCWGKSEATATSISNNGPASGIESSLTIASVSSSEATRVLLKLADNTGIIATGVFDKPMNVNNKATMMVDGSSRPSSTVASSAFVPYGFTIPSESHVYSRISRNHISESSAGLTHPEKWPMCAHGGESIVTGSDIHLSASCRSLNADADVVLTIEEQNVTITPSPSIHIFESEVDMNLDRSASSVPDGCADPQKVCALISSAPDRSICFDGGMPSGTEEGSQSLSRPLADMRVALKEASA